MIVIGSRALCHHGVIKSTDIKNSDWDFISTEASWNDFKSKMLGTEVEVKNPSVRAFKCVHGGKETHFESYVISETDALDNSNRMLLEYAKKHCEFDKLSGFYWATPEMCLAIKMSHRFKKNTRFFRKTMQHINFLRSKGVQLNDELNEIMLKRQKETLSYNHPVLDVNKSEFFNDSIYTYDHDTIHEAVALLEKPAYTFYMKENSQVMVDKEKFFALPEEIRLAGVYEETCVLALERSQVPGNFMVPPQDSFMMALEKVCTSITSGWFREYAWENYNKVVFMYKSLGENDYVKRFHDNIHMIKPFES